jgi:SAM-dependent methyltransferase
MQRVFKNGRLIYYRQEADAGHWDRVWERQDTKVIYADAQKGSLGHFEEIFPKHLPKQGKILEAGCGLGQLVIALRVRGYDAEGVDYAEQTIRKLRSMFPEIPFRVGDVTHLEDPDGKYIGYISLGVVEHVESGPDPFLREAHRLLGSGGIACISVPYLNVLRRLKVKLGLFSTGKVHDPFYQYAFSSNEFSKILRKFGFELINTYQYSGYKGVKDEMPFITKIFKWPQGWRLQKWLMNSRWVARHNGHMMLYVVRKI